MSTRVALRLPARAENVPLVRQIARGVCDALNVDPDNSHAVALAVTEACSNSLLHAYTPGSEHWIDVTFGDHRSNLVVAVRDYGRGPYRPSPDPGAGFGLVLIAELTRQHVVEQPSGGGTLVTMVFDAVVTPGGFNGGSTPAGFAVRIDSTGRVAPAVLARLFTSLAARASESVDRVRAAASAGHAAGRIVSSAGVRYIDALVVEGSGAVTVRLTPLADGVATGFAEAACAFEPTIATDGSVSVTFGTGSTSH